MPSEREEMTTIEEINQEVLSAWKGYYQVAPNYDMHETEIECCCEIAFAILEWHKNKLQVGKTQNKYSDYNGGSVTPNKGRMK